MDEHFEHELRASDLSAERIARLTREEMRYVAKHLLVKNEQSSDSVLLSMEQVSLFVKRLEDIIMRRE